MKEKMITSHLAMKCNILNKIANLRYDGTF